jgi:hypothetical protein
MPCFTVEWPDITQSKIDFLTSNNNIICDITSADQISYVDLCKLKKHFYIVKVLSTHVDDLTNLEDTWNKNTYDYNQWIQAMLCRLSVADDIFFYDDRTFVLPSKQINKLIFSPGRCGTHVLKEITGVTDHFHHEHGISKAAITKLTNTSKLFAILRKNFFKFVISMFAIKTTGKTMLSRSISEFEKNKQIVKESSPLTITVEEFEQEFNTVATFLDILIGCKLVWQKDISFYYLEDLSSHFNNLKIFKNPYTDTDIVKNYIEAVELGKEYQEWYDYLIKQTNSLFKSDQI